MDCSKQIFHQPACWCYEAKREEKGVCLTVHKEQNQFVLGIKSHLTVVDKFEETITNSLQQAEALRQSILRKAFERERL